MDLGALVTGLVALLAVVIGAVVVGAKTVTGGVGVAVIIEDVAVALAAVVTGLGVVTLLELVAQIDFGTSPVMVGAAIVTGAVVNVVVMWGTGTVAVI